MMDQPAPEDFDLDRLVERLGTPPAAPLAMPRQVLAGPGAELGLRALPRPPVRVVAVRVAALSFSLFAGAAAFLLFLQFGAADGLTTLDGARAGLIFLTTWWLAWGAAQAVVGLLAGPGRRQRGTGPVTTRTVVIVPIYDEDPVVTFARIAAMHASLRTTGYGDRFSFAILSDTRDEAVAEEERRWFLRLLSETDGEGRIFYRRRAQNTGKKAGNVEEFLRASGAAWDFALILDADSLMEGETVVEMVRRMEAAPRLGLLQTLPRVIRARSRFGRAMQFSAGFFAPVFARGLAVMQGHAGPFWGHNALVRIAAFTASCGLPALPGRAPFGGPILSHDYVEAAMLARAGWQVRLDDDLEGSFEEGPETLIDHAKRDRRWCQGNLQHAGVLGAAGLAPWHRFTFVQGIFAYLAPLFWLTFMGLSVWAELTRPLSPDYFEPMNPVPMFPIDETWKAVVLFLTVFGLLFLPKLAVALQAMVTGRAGGFGGIWRAARSTLTELALSSLIAPILLMFQTRSVLQVLSGRDGGWPAQSRESQHVPLQHSWRATWWIVTFGGSVLAAILLWAPMLAGWLMPVLLPMIAAPLVVTWLSGPSVSDLFLVPQEVAPSPVIRAHLRLLRRWRGTRQVEEGVGTEVAPPLDTPGVALR